MSDAADILETLRRDDRDRFLAALFAPEPARRDIAAIGAFNAEIARIRETVREPALGAIRLQWWREALDGVEAGAPRRHPVVEALARAHARKPLTRGHFERLIDARARDLDDAAFADWGELDAYAEATGAPPVLLALDALGAAEESAVEAARHVGAAYALAGMLTAIPFRAARGRPTMLPSERFPAVEVARVAARHLASGRALRARVPKTARPALILGVLADVKLRALARVGHDPFAITPAAGRALTPLRLTWAAWRGRY